MRRLKSRARRVFSDCCCDQAGAAAGDIGTAFAYEVFAPNTLVGVIIGVIIDVIVLSSSTSSA